MTIDRVMNAERPIRIETDARQGFGKESTKSEESQNEDDDDDEADDIDDVVHECVPCAE